MQVLYKNHSARWQFACREIIKLENLVRKRH